MVLNLFCVVRLRFTRLFCVFFKEMFLWNIRAPPARVPYAKTFPRKVLATLLRTIFLNFSRPAGRDQRLCLWNSPPFEKGGPKLLSPGQYKIGARENFSPAPRFFFILSAATALPRGCGHPISSARAARRSASAHRPLSLRAWSCTGVPLR